MNKTLTTSLAAIGLAGAGIIGVGAIANAQYGGDDPTSDDTTTQTATDDGTPQGIVAGTEGEAGDPRGHHAPHCDPEVVADALGISTDQLEEFRQQGMSIADVADEVGVDVDSVIAAIVGDIQEHLADEVASGDLTQDEADQRLADATERVTEHVDAEPGEGGPRGARGPRGNPETVADALGITTDQLEEFRQQGLSLADIAAQQGVSVDTLVDAIVADVEEHLADEVAEGDLTQYEADQRLADATERVTDKVNAEPGEGGFRGPDGPRGPRPDAPADGAEA